MKDLWLKIPPYVRNKYTITIIGFVLWMLCFDQNDVISQIKWRAELNALQNDKAYFREQIDATRADLNELMTNEALLEKFAREKYLMKKPNEIVYVIVPEKE